MTVASRPTLSRLLAGAAFLTYAISILWLHAGQKSAWKVELQGPIPFATSYLYYNKPFGIIDSGIWDAVKTSGPERNASTDSFLRDIAQKNIPPGPAMPTTVDGNGLGYPFFATASLFMFGARTLSLVIGFVLVLGVSVAAFLLRFPDNRSLAIPFLFLALTLMLFTPHATMRDWIDQAPIGGYRFFVIAGIVPTLHIILELFDTNVEIRKSPKDWFLLGLQLVVVLIALSARMSASYFVGAIVFAALLSVWIGRNDASARRLVIGKIAFLLAVALAANLGARLVTPTPYVVTGLSSETFWHRAFIGLGIHPNWPFGDLASTYDCKPDVPDGLQPGNWDTNGHCVYVAAVRHGATPGPIYGTQYERLLRQTFFDVAYRYPWQVVQTYTWYKPLLLWDTILFGTRLHITRQNAPILVALALQLAFLLAALACHVRERAELRQICGAFAIIGLFSLFPQIFAWSSVATSTDIICFVFVGFALILAGTGKALIWQLSRA